MIEFPAFMKNPANRIDTTSQYTDGIEGYVFNGADGSQMAFWTCYENSDSKEHTHEYGNRAYEDALLELRDVVTRAGFKPIAAGAFIGEHSYSTKSTPVAVGRPDVEDLGEANAFGMVIREKMRKIRALDQINPLQVPGNFPFKELRMLSDISPAIQEELCIRCKKCISVCPTAAINSDDPALTDKGLCIRCCACVKGCPVGAKTMDDPVLGRSPSN